MPTCRFSFIYKGRQLCVLEQRCAYKGPKEQQTCQKVHEFYDNLTPNEIKNLQQKLIYKLDFHPTLQYEGPPLEINETVHSQQIVQSKEKLRGLKIRF